VETVLEGVLFISPWGRLLENITLQYLIVKVDVVRGFSDDGVINRLDIIGSLYVPPT
jgi:hypothetical protein